MLAAASLSRCRGVRFDITKSIHDSDKLRLMMERGRVQPKPLKRSGEAEEKFERFFEVMATLWHIADEYDMTHQIQFTNFVTFGPQSAGKTTITGTNSRLPRRCRENWSGNDAADDIND
jgi:hypothetical protein